LNGAILVKGSSLSSCHCSLVENAVQYGVQSSPKAGHLRLVIVRRVGEWLDMSISDDGQGVPATEVNEFSSPCVRASMRCPCCHDGCKHCLVAPFGWRCVARLNREPQSPCTFPCEQGLRLQERRWKALRQPRSIGARLAQKSHERKRS
jgi:hypothetical protein